MSRNESSRERKYRLGSESSTYLWYFGSWERNYVLTKFPVIAAGATAEEAWAGRRRLQELKTCHNLSTFSNILERLALVRLKLKVTTN